MRGAWKVGALVVSFLAALGGAYAVLDHALFAPAVDVYTATFRDAGQVTRGAPVFLSGVRVGQVREVKLAGVASAEIAFEVEQGTPIAEGTVAVIPSSLIGIGDRPIELVPPDLPTTALLKPGARLQGTMKSPLESLSPESKETLAALNDTLQATQGLLQDAQLRNRIEALLESSNKTIVEFGALARQLSGVIGQNQATLQATLRQANRLMNDLAEATSVVTRIARDGKVEGQLTGLLAEMDSALKESSALVADLRKAVNDPELNSGVRTIVANTTTMTDSGTRIAANAEVMTKNGITLSEQAIELSKKLSALADEVSELLKRANTALDKVVGLAPGGRLPAVSATMDITRESDPGRFRTDFEASASLGEDRLYLGVWDAFESNKLIAQLGRSLDERTEFRYGVYASKPGIGVTFRVAPGALLRGDLFDVNEPRLDFRARIDFSREWSGWLGVERVFDRNSPSIGIGVRR